MIPPRIAVVHTDPSVSNLLATLLDDEGYLPIVAPEIEGTCEAFQGAHPDLVIVDIGYGPAHPGWALVEQLRADPLTRHVPVIGLTTASNPEEARPAGCHSRCEIVPSPFDINVVLGAVRSLLKSPHHCHRP